MARGKKAATAAIRRAEAAHEHIDRLTDELVEAKLRARSLEGVSRKAPVLEARIEKLSADLVRGTSDEIRRLSRSLQEVTAERDALAESLRTIQGHWNKVVSFLIAAESSDGQYASGASSLLRLLGRGDVVVRPGDIHESVLRTSQPVLAVQRISKARARFTNPPWWQLTGQ